MLIDIQILFTENHLPQPRWFCSQTCPTCCATFLPTLSRGTSTPPWTTLCGLLCQRSLMHPLDLCIPLQSFNNALICLNITQHALAQCGSLKKATGKRGARATVENKTWFTLNASLTMLMWAQRVCCSRFQIPQYSYHLVNWKVHANKNKSFLCCSGPPLHNSWLCSCSVLWKTNSAVQLGSSRQQKGNFNPFFSFGTTQIYLVIKRGKAPHHLRRIGKWERKLCQILSLADLETQRARKWIPNRSKCSTHRGV